MGRSMFPLFFRHNAHFLPHLKGAIAYSVEKHKDLRVSSFWTGSQSFFFFLPVPMLRLHCQNKEGTPLYPVIFLWLLGLNLLEVPVYTERRIVIKCLPSEPKILKHSIGLFLCICFKSKTPLPVSNTLYEIVSISAVQALVQTNTRL